MKVRAYEDRRGKIVEAFPQYSQQFTNKQLAGTWLPEEVKLHKDKQNIMVEMPASSRHGIQYTLKLFTKYEMFAGEEYWSNRFIKIMKGPEFTRMGTTFAAFEQAIHKPFYQKINEIFGLDTDEFYEEYANDPVLKERMDFIDSIVNHENDLVSLGAFSMVEGAILYSSFAFLKHFQANGKSDAKNVVAGVNFSQVDENIHSLAGATCYRHLMNDCVEDGILEQRYGKREDIEQQLYKIAETIYEHEAYIADRIFDKGPIKGITATQLKNFVKSRLNECLHNLGLKSLFVVTYNPIKEWFYDDINSYNVIDFFNSTGSQYTRKWIEDDFDYLEDGEELEIFE